jgi:hypothetical protein
VSRRLFLGRYSLSIGSREVELSKTFSHQFMYGAREVLLDYCEIPKDRLLLGVLQHGVGPTLNQFINVPSPRIGIKRSPVWLASHSVAQEIKKCGYKEVSAIGSTWAYLLKKTVAVPEEIGDRREKILFFPSHWGGHEYSNEEVIQICTSLRKRFPNEYLSISVYFIDLLCADWPRIASSFGIQILNAGMGGSDPYWSNFKARTNFLPRLREYIMQHDHCVFEEFSSAIFYAISLKKRVTVNKLPFLDHRQSPDAAVNDWMRKNLPKIYDGIYCDALAQEISDDLLGTNVTLSKEDLSERLKYVRLELLAEYRAPEVG